MLGFLRQKVQSAAIKRSEGECTITESARQQILATSGSNHPHNFEKSRNFFASEFPGRSFTAPVPSRQFLRVGVLSVDKATEVQSFSRRFLCVLLAKLANNSMETALFTTRALGQFLTAVEKLVMGKSCASTSVKLRQKSNDNCISGA